MRIRKGTPGKGGGSRPDSFSYTPVKHGTANGFNGWLAGEPYWCEEAHEHIDYDPGTRPCLHWMTNGEVQCARCRRGRPVKCIGWVPLYTEVDTAQIIVIVHEKVADALFGLKYPTFCSVGRVGLKSSVYVRRAPVQVPFKTENESRKCPVDVTGDLLTIWNMPELNAWLARPEQFNAPEHAPGGGEPTTTNGKPFGPMYRNAALRAANLTTNVEGAELLGNVADDVLAKTKAAIGYAEKNGKHHTNGNGRGDKKGGS